MFDKIASRGKSPAMLSLIALTGMVVLVYATTLGTLMVRWRETDYAHGFLVVPFSVLLLFLRREMIPKGEIRGSWWGLVIIAVAIGMRCVGAFASDPLVDPLSLVVTVFGLAVFLGGMPIVRWAWPAIIYLVFMIPLPNFLEGYMGLPLQRIGTVVSTYIIQTIGIKAQAAGNVITLPKAQLGVVEACSGLRMLALFCAVCVGAAFVMRVSVWERILIIASAPPIAVASNVIRITVTALMYEWTTRELADKVFHDLAGYFMMPLAVGMLALELSIFRWIVPTKPAEEGDLLQALSAPPPSRPS